MKRYSLLIGPLILLLFVSACTKEASPTVSKAFSVQATPKFHDNFSDEKFDQISVQKVDIIKGDLMGFDLDAVRGVFFQEDDEYSIIETDDTDGVNTAFYITKDRSSLAILRGTIIYHTEFAEHIQFVRNLSQAGIMSEGYQDPFESEKAFEHLSLDDAIENSKEFLSLLGVETELQNILYMDHEIMEEIEHNFMQKEENREWVNANRSIFKEQWSADDDCYYLRFAPKLSSLPLDTNDRPKGYSKSSYPSSVIDILYSQDGIVGLALHGAYRTIEVIKDVETSTPDVTLEELQKNLKQ